MQTLDGPKGSSGSSIPTWATSSCLFHLVMMSSLARAWGYWSRISNLIFHTRSFSCSYSSVWLLLSRISFSCSFCSGQAQHRAPTSAQLSSHSLQHWSTTGAGWGKVEQPVHGTRPAGSWKLMPQVSPPQNLLVQLGVVLHSSPAPAAGTQIKRVRKVPQFLCNCQHHSRH